MSGKRARRMTCVSLALAALFGVQPAAAFCRSSSCQLGEQARQASGGPACQRDADDCVNEGNPLHWANPCLQYAVQEDGSANLGLTAEQFRSAIEEAFAAWRGVSCPGGGTPRFEARFQGFVACPRREAVCGDESANVNTFMLHDRDWPGEDFVLGLTTPSGGTRSGLVVDADLELNSEDYRFAFGAETQGFALADVLSHEVGHFLGLDHSLAPGALMSEDYQSLEGTRELFTDDDVAGICATFPPGPALSCSLPAAPAYRDCQVVPGTSNECQLASMTHDEPHGACGYAAPRGAPRQLWIGGVAVAAAALRRRRSSLLTAPTPQNP